MIQRVSMKKKSGSGIDGQLTELLLSALFVMSFSKGDTNSVTAVALSGSNGIALPTALEPIYTRDGGQTWTASSGAVTGLTALALDGTNGIATKSGSTMVYTTNTGETWNTSYSPSGLPTTFNAVALSGSYGLASSTSNSTVGVWQTNDAGSTWRRWGISTSATTFRVAVSGLYGTAACNTGSFSGAYYTTDGGVNWSQSKDQTGAYLTGFYRSIALSGANGIMSTTSATNGGLYYTTDGGATWKQSTNVTSGSFNSLYLNGTDGVAGSGLNQGLYYTTDGGHTWTQSNVKTGTFNAIALSDVYGLAGSTTRGVYYTDDTGHTWTQSSLTGSTPLGTVSFGSVAITAPDTAIAASATSSPEAGLFYLLSPLCFNKGTKILCVLENGRQTWTPIEDLNRGDVVRTYKHGDRKIAHIVESVILNNPDRFNTCMYRMRKTEANELSEDLIVTGGHSILVDDLGDARDANERIFGSLPMIDDKYLLLAAVSQDFAKIESHDAFTCYHLVLENDGDDDQRFGVWSNGILTETPSKNQWKASSVP
ncbi:hypothetical protein EBZ80_20545 [bacterium]|nr:hypothetical protein [bacterium]